jgi:hypothetical protein
MEATRRIQTLRADDGLFRAAANRDKQALEHFLEDYPGHHREAEARSLLRSGDVGPQDITSLVDGKKIEFRAKGAGIDSVNIQIRRRANHILIVRILPGVLFVPRRDAAQTMIGTEQRDTWLEGPDWVSVDVPVACTNLAKYPPDSEDAMQVRRATNAELEAIAPRLARVSVATRQAAIWIVTDNANYAALGKLVTGPFGAGGRVIDEDHAAEAMRLCESNGINIHKRAIWRDRSRISRGLKSAELRQWLEKASTEK